MTQTTQQTKSTEVQIASPSAPLTPRRHSSLSRQMIVGNGVIEWRNQEGELHRENGPAIEHPDGSMWCRNGWLHREDGPAFETADGEKRWYINGELHREDGPAVTYESDILKACCGEEWWLHDEKLTEREWRERTGN